MRKGLPIALIAAALAALVSIGLAHADGPVPGGGGGGGGAPSGAAGGDLGSTYPNPTVTATHLSVALPQAQGGTGAGALTCAAGTHLTSNGTAQSCSADSGGQPDYGTSRRWGAYSPTNTTTATLTQWGLQAPTVTTPGGAASASQAFARTLVFYSTAASGGSVCGNSGPYNETRPSYGPVMTMTFIFPGASNNRTWVGLASASLGALAGAASGASAIHFVGFLQDTGFSANWQLCSGDGTNFTCTDTGAAAGASTVTARVKLDWSTQTSLVGTLWTSASPGGACCGGGGAADNWVQQYSGTKATNLSTSNTVDIGPSWTTTALAGVLKNFFISSLVLQQNP